MARRSRLTDKMIATLPRKARRYLFADPEQPNLFLRVPPEGAAAFTVIVKRKRTQHWCVVGSTDVMGIDAAREKAREIIRRVKAGLDPVEKPPPPPRSVAVVAREWLQRVADARKHRTAPEQRRVVERYLVRSIGDHDFATLRRSDIARLLDKVEDAHGVAMADKALSVLRAIAHWVQSRDDVYAAPFVRGMGRVPAAQQRRSRTLSDDELRRVWHAADGPFGAIVKLLLLTGQSAAKVAGMRWQDLAGGIWNIPREEREKQNAGQLRLPKLALDIIAAQPQLAGSALVFPGSPLRGTGKAKLDRVSGVHDWRVHDLRRTSRSLLARCGVRHEIAEAVLGHALPGVAQIYNRYHYDHEKSEALRELAASVKRIVDPPADNVVTLHEAVS
jgi:integrase